MKLLLRATNWVGDVVMSLPALRALRESFRGDYLAVQARPWVAELYRLRPEVDRLIVEAPGSEAGLLSELRSLRFDRTVVLPTSFRTAWLAFRAGIPERFGYRGELRGPLLTHPVALDLGPGEHQVWKHLRLAAAAGATMPERPDTSWAVPRAERERAQRRLAEAGHGGEPFVAVHAASFAHAAKRWPLAAFAELLDGLRRERGLVPVLLGSAGEAGVNAELAARLRLARAVDLSGRSTLPEALGLVALARLFVGNDSGLSHLSAAAGTPTVVVFGPTDPEATRPWDGPRGDGRPALVEVVRARPACAPCRFAVCPIDHRCMRGVSVGRVLEACGRLLA